MRLELDPLDSTEPLSIIRRGCRIYHRQRNQKYSIWHKAEYRSHYTWIPISFHPSRQRVQEIWTLCFYVYSRLLLCANTRVAIGQGLLNTQGKHTLLGLCFLCSIVPFAALTARKSMQTVTIVLFVDAGVGLIWSIMASLEKARRLATFGRDKHVFAAGVFSPSPTPPPLLRPSYPCLAQSP